MPQYFVKVILRLVNDSDGSPLDGPGFYVRLYDQDPFVEDFLGEAVVRVGRAEILFDIDRVRSFDSPSEKRPDLFFLVFEHGEEIYRSQVEVGHDFLSPDPRTGIRRSLTKDLGEFRVQARTR